MALQTHSPRVAAPARHRITVAEFERMIAANVWPEDERLELVEGELIAMSPLNAPHAYAVRTLIQLFAERLRGRALLDAQNPILLDDGTRPEPDVSLLRLPASLYRRRLPTSSDVLLIIEVSDITLDYDRETKARLYARAGIPELWVLDLNGERLIVSRGLENGEYTHIESLKAGATIAPTAFPDVVLSVNEILGLSPADATGSS
jgi:Uma2 family endonuclease